MFLTASFDVAINHRIVSDGQTKLNSKDGLIKEKEQKQNSNRAKSKTNAVWEGCAKLLRCDSWFTDIFNW